MAETRVQLHMREVRERKGIQMYRVAEALGRTQGWLSRMERSEYHVTLQLIDEYARVLDCDPRELFSFRGYPDHPAGRHEDAP